MNSYVYILTNVTNRVLYVGVTSNLVKREKQIKGGSREKKLQLIEKANPLFEDLYQSIL